MCKQCEDERPRFAPSDLTLPFFAYGIFRPGQLAYPRIADCVAETQPVVVRGRLLERDGLPILDLSGNTPVPGDVVLFEESKGPEGYHRIAQLEPESQYRWGLVSPSEGRTANALLGRSPEKGSRVLDDPDWDGRKDPLLTTALDVVEEAIKASSDFDWNLKPLFRVQMAYLLLWSAIERFASFRYHLGDRPWHKVSQLASEPCFRAALAELSASPAKVQRADRPADTVRFDPNKAESVLEYFYQLRNNISHRGKAGPNDFDRLLAASQQLLAIARRVFSEAFGKPSGPRAS